MFSRQFGVLEGRLKSPYYYENSHRIVVFLFTQYIVSNFFKIDFFNSLLDVMSDPNRKFSVLVMELQGGEHLLKGFGLFRKFT
jgi:hypothetical protein